MIAIVVFVGYAARLNSRFQEAVNAYERLEAEPLIC